MRVFPTGTGVWDLGFWEFGDVGFGFFFPTGILRKGVVALGGGTGWGVTAGTCQVGGVDGDQGILSWPGSQSCRERDGTGTGDMDRMGTGDRGGDRMGMGTRTPLATPWATPCVTPGYQDTMTHPW